MKMTFEAIFGDPGAAPNVLEKRMLDFSQRTKAQNVKKLTFCNVTVSAKIGTLLGFSNRSRSAHRNITLLCS